MKTQVIKIEDTRESLTNALQEIVKTMQNGGGIGIDVTALSRPEQAEVERAIGKVQFSHLIAKEGRSH